MNPKGFYLSLEAILSLTALGLILSMPLHPENSGFQELHAFQKENDLIRGWSKSEELSLDRMKSDFEKAFPGKGGKIFLDSQSVEIGKQGLEGISAEAVFFEGGLRKRCVALIVFKQDFS